MVARIVEIDVPGAPRFVIERPDGSLLMTPLASSMPITFSDLHAASAAPEALQLRASATRGPVTRVKPS